MFINDLEEKMRVKGCSGLTINDLKLVLMLWPCRRYRCFIGNFHRVTRKSGCYVRLL